MRFTFKTREVRGQTYGAVIDEEVIELHEDAACLFGVGVFVELGVEVAELEGGGRDSIRNKRHNYTNIPSRG